MEHVGKEWEDIQTEFEAEQLRFIRAELNALLVKFREEIDREEKGN
jgi:hypothetical protein